MAEPKTPSWPGPRFERLNWPLRLSVTLRILLVNLLPLLMLGGGTFYLDSYRKQLLSERYKLARIEAQEEIQARVQSELGERQREMLLREQLKQIQKELGEEEEQGDLDELKERIEALELNDEVRTEVDRELRRLERTSPQSAEYQVIRTFLEWVIDLPWSERTEDKIVLSRSAEILDEDHYGLDDVKDRVLEFLAVRKLQVERAPEAEPAVSEGEPAPVLVEAFDTEGVLVGEFTVSPPAHNQPAFAGFFSPRPLGMVQIGTRETAAGSMISNLQFGGSAGRLQPEPALLQMGSVAIGGSPFDELAHCFPGDISGIGRECEPGNFVGEQLHVGWSVVGGVSRLLRPRLGIE